MALSKFTKDMGIIAKLEDEPNDVGGLTAAQLKAKFDEAGEAVKDYLNDTLLPELENPAAAAALGAVLEGKETTVQGALDLLLMASIQSGNVPTGGAAGEYLRKRSDAMYDLEWGELGLFHTVAFAAADWVSGSDGYTLTVAAADHGRSSAAFGCALRHRVDGVLKANTWAVLGTGSSYDEATGVITLTSPAAYEGTAVFYG